VVLPKAISEVAPRHKTFRIAVSWSSLLLSTVTCEILEHSLSSKEEIASEALDAFSGL